MGSYYCLQLGKECSNLVNKLMEEKKCNLRVNKQLIFQGQPEASQVLDFNFLMKKLFTMMCIYAELYLRNALQGIQNLHSVHFNFN